MAAVKRSADYYRQIDRRMGIDRPAMVNGVGSTHTGV